MRLVRTGATGVDPANSDKLSSLGRRRERRMRLPFLYAGPDRAASSSPRRSHDARRERPRRPGRSLHSDPKVAGRIVPPTPLIRRRRRRVRLFPKTGPPKRSSNKRPGRCQLTTLDGELDALATSVRILAPGPVPFPLQPSARRSKVASRRRRLRELLLGPRSSRRSLEPATLRSQVPPPLKRGTRSPDYRSGLCSVHELGDDDQPRVDTRRTT